MAPLPSEDFFASVKSRVLTESLHDLSFVMAEAEDGPRQHRRILAVCPNNPALHGKPIAYSDTYLTSGEPVTYVYARHRWGVASFLSELDDFILKNFEEWRTRKFGSVLNVEGKRVLGETGMPFGSNLSNQALIRFARIDMPFGPISIEFGPAKQTGNELSALEQSRLPLAIETPLIGCDISQTSLPTILIARKHWASDLIPVAILTNLLRGMELPVTLRWR